MRSLLSTEKGLEVIGWWRLLLAVPLAFLVGVIFGSGLVLFDPTGLHDFFNDLATEHLGLNRASGKTRAIRSIIKNRRTIKIASK